MLDLVTPKFTLLSLTEGFCIACVPVAPSMVIIFWLKCATREETTECSAPVSTMKVIVRPSTFMLTVGSWGAKRERARSPSVRFYPSQTNKVLASRFFPIWLGFEGPFRFGHSFFQYPFSAVCTLIPC